MWLYHTRAGFVQLDCCSSRVYTACFIASSGLRAQDLDAFEFKLRINVFDRQNFKMVSSAKLPGDELKQYLKIDKKNYLLEVNKREELGKYLVENILVD